MVPMRRRLGVAHEGIGHAPNRKEVHTARYRSVLTVVACRTPVSGSSTPGRFCNGVFPSINLVRCICGSMCKRVGRGSSASITSAILLAVGRWSCAAFESHTRRCGVPHHPSCIQPGVIELLLPRSGEQSFYHQHSDATTNRLLFGLTAGSCTCL